MKFLKSKIILILLVVIAIFGDYFYLSRLDPVSHNKQGYYSSYPSTITGQWQNTPQYGYKRIEYNFAHFSLFWLKIPDAARFSDIYQFLVQDNNPFYVNLSHFICFFLFTLILLWWFKIKWWQAFFIGIFINVFHEYVAEGIYVDPSFIDLWLDIFGILSGLLIGLMVRRYQESIKVFAG